MSVNLLKDLYILAELEPQWGKGIVPVLLVMFYTFFSFTLYNLDK